MKKIFIVGEEDNFVNSFGNNIKEFDEKITEKIKIKSPYFNQDRKIYDKLFNEFISTKNLVSFNQSFKGNYIFARTFFDSCESDGKIPFLLIFNSHLQDFQNKIFWMEKLLMEGFPSENILFIGGRFFCEEEKKFLKKWKIKYFSMNALFLDLENQIDLITESVYGKKVLCFFGSGIFDFSFFQSSPSCECGGLSFREFFYLFERINKIPGLAGINFFDFNFNEQNIYFKKFLSNLFYFL